MRWLIVVTGFALAAAMLAIALWLAPSSGGPVVLGYAAGAVVALFMALAQGWWEERHDR